MSDFQSAKFSIISEFNKLISERIEKIKEFEKIDKKIKTSEFRSILSWKINLGSKTWFKIGKELESYGLIEMSKRYVKIRGVRNE